MKSLEFNHLHTLKSSQLNAGFVLVLTLLLSFTALNVQAQLTQAVKTADTKTQVSLSEITTFGNNEIVPYEILPYGEDFVLSSFSEIRGNALSGGLDDLLSLKLHLYNSDLQKTKTIEVPWPDEQRDHFDVSSLGNKLAWTYTTPTSKKGIFQVEMEVIDKQGKLISNHPLLKIDRREYPFLADLKSQSANLNYYARVFAEESTQRLISKRDDVPAKMTLVVFDSDGMLVSKITKRLRYDRDQVKIQSIAVDEDGKAYVLAKIYTNSQRRETAGGSDSKVFLYTLEPGAEELERIEMKLAGQYIEGITMVPGVSGLPAIVGLYTSRRNGRIEGYFSTDNPQKGEVLKPVAFSQQMLANLGRRITAKRKGSLVLEGNFLFRDAIRLRNGKLTILLESFQIVNNNNNAGFGVGGIGMGGVNNFTYIYGEGVMLTFGNDGKLEEALEIPKFQSTQNEYAPFFSLNLVEYKSRAAAIYNDNPRNFTRDLSKSPRSLVLNRALAIVSFADNQGKLQRDPIFGRLDADKLILVPSSASRLKNQDVVFMALRNRTFSKNEIRFGRISE